MKKYARGRREHGDYDVTASKIDLFAELEDECYDVSNYAQMLWRHVRHLKSQYHKLEKYANKQP